MTNRKQGVLAWKQEFRGYEQLGEARLGGRRSGKLDAETTLAVTIAPQLGDFGEIPENIVFAPGERVQELAIRRVNDDLREGKERFRMKLSDADEMIVSRGSGTDDSGP